MHRQLPRVPARRAAGLALALACAACGSTPVEVAEPPAERPPGEYQSAPWTEAFREPANLIANEIVIEGPPGLREHIAVRQDSGGARYDAKATPRGFLQEVVARPEAGYVEIHATLDGWQLVAFRRLTVLERPGDAPVLVRATGAVTWQSIADGRERRDEVLEFRGDVGR